MYRNEFKEDSYFIAAPILINGKENVVTVTVHVDSNTHRMYLHGVMVKEGLMKPRVSATLERNSRTHYGSLTSSDLHNILHNALTLKTSALKVGLDKNGEPDFSTVGESTER